MSSIAIDSHRSCPALPLKCSHRTVIRCYGSQGVLWEVRGIPTQPTLVQAVHPFHLSHGTSGTPWVVQCPCCLPAQLVQIVCLIPFTGQGTPWVVQVYLYRVYMLWWYTSLEEVCKNSSISYPNLNPELIKQGLLMVHCIWCWKSFGACKCML